MRGWGGGWGGKRRRGGKGGRGDQGKGRCGLLEKGGWGRGPHDHPPTRNEGASTHRAPAPRTSRVGLLHHFFRYPAPPMSSPPQGTRFPPTPGGTVTK